MDFKSAIAAHSAWKARLTNYLKKPDRSLDAKVVAAHDACELGKWLLVDGKRSMDPAEYANLVAVHGRFHKAAADVIRRADQGRNVTGEVALGGNSEVSVASTEVVKLLMALAAKR